MYSWMQTAGRDRKCHCQVRESSGHGVRESGQVVALVNDLEFMLCIDVLAKKMVIHILAAHIGALAHERFVRVFCLERLFLFLVVPIL